MIIYHSRKESSKGDQAHIYNSLAENQKDGGSPIVGKDGNKQKIYRPLLQLNSWLVSAPGFPFGSHSFRERSQEAKISLPISSTGRKGKKKERKETFPKNKKKQTWSGEESKLLEY